MPKKIIKEFEIYNYGELQDSAKKVARSEISERLTETRNEDLKTILLGQSLNYYGLKLDEDSLQYSLTWSQGDGVSFTSDSLVRYSRLKNPAKYDLNVFEKTLLKQLSKEDLTILLNYLNQDGRICIYRDDYRYTHSWTCKFDFILYYSDDKSETNLVNTHIQDIITDVLRPTYDEVCDILEKVGYDYLEASEEAIENYIEDFDINFFEDGTISNL